IALSTEPTGREAFGLYAALAEEARLYLTTPMGERIGFTFTPVEEKIGGRSFWRAGWTADGDAEWALQSADMLLRKSGGRFFTADDGLAYNPTDPFVGGAQPFLLTGPDGTAYAVSSDGRVQEIRKEGARLFVGDSGITADNGAVLNFLRDADGRIARVTTPDGKATVYSYDDKGQLTRYRALEDGSGGRFGYDDTGRLAVTTGGSGTPRVIVYDGDGGIVETPLHEDLGGISQFTGRVISGDASGGSQFYTLTIRDSDLVTGAGGNGPVVRVETSSEATTPEIDGGRLLSLQRSGGKTVALYRFEAAGLYTLALSGGSEFDLVLGAAGDINADGSVNGTDSDLLRDGGVDADITGDGTIDA
ncbi:hypothetical protein AB9K41_27770, partial [Cribrihabitans sp. XS_ASV171]